MTEPVQPAPLDYDDDPADEPGVGFDRKTLLLALAAIGVVALGLAALRNAGKRHVVQDTQTPGEAVSQALASGDWQASIEHLAGVWDVRFAGLDDRIDALTKARIASTSVAQPVKPPAPAATSIAPPVLVPQQENGDHATAADVAGVDMAPPPPGPAAVSVQP